MLSRPAVGPVAKGDRSGGLLPSSPSATPEQAMRDEPEEGWAGAVISAPSKMPRTPRSRCRRTLQQARVAGVAAVARDHRPEPDLGDLEIREDLFDDFTLFSSMPDEIEARLSHLFFRTGRGKRDDIIVYGALALNLETYQAVVAGRPLDLTFMEYELLRFLAAHPGSVFTREVLLSRVWGYEYFGGARTVDVHIRRLRAKLGEEHAHLIDTVRSVGYRFGSARWTPNY